MSAQKVILKLYLQCLNNIKTSHNVQPNEWICRSQQLEKKWSIGVIKISYSSASSHVPEE